MITESAELVNLEICDVGPGLPACRRASARHAAQKRGGGPEGPAPPRRLGPQIRYYVEVDWNDAAEDFLNQVLSQTPRPVRDATEAELRGVAEAMAEEDGKQRVGVETVIAAWVRLTPETLRADLPRQMERFGLDPADYRNLLE
jgi:hypothetical protein